jgi:hypothetical protein
VVGIKAIELVIGGKSGWCRRHDPARCVVLAPDQGSAAALASRNPNAFSSRHAGHLTTIGLIRGDMFAIAMRSAFNAASWISEKTRRCYENNQQHPATLAA